MKISDIFIEIERERKKRGMSVEELCSNADVTIYTYYHWLQGLSKPRLGSLAAIMDAIGLEVEIVHSKNELR